MVFITLDIAKREKEKMRPTKLGIVVMSLIVGHILFLYELSNQIFFFETMEIDYTINDHNSPHKLMIDRNNLGNQMDTVYAFTNEDDINDSHNHINSNNNNKTRSLTPNQLNLITLAENQGILRVQDKGPLIEILTQAGVNVKKKGNLDQEIIDSLPTWTQVTNLYGSAPIIHGLERCKEYRTNVEASTRFLGIAGTFNTGTNLLADLMRFNCQIVERMEVYGKKSKGVRWQVSLIVSISTQTFKNIIIFKKRIYFL